MSRGSGRVRRWCFRKLSRAVSLWLQMFSKTPRRSGVHLQGCLRYAQQLFSKQLFTFSLQFLTPFFKVLVPRFAPALFWPGVVKQLHGQKRVLLCGWPYTGLGQCTEDLWWFWIVFLGEKARHWIEIIYRHCFFKLLASAMLQAYACL